MTDVVAVDLLLNYVYFGQNASAANSPSSAQQPSTSLNENLCSAADLNSGVVALVKELGCFPLSITQAGIYIFTTSCTPKEYMDRLHESPMQLNRDVSLMVNRDGYEYGSIQDTWSASYDKLGESSKDLMRLIAWMDPGNIQQELFKNLSGLEGYESQYGPLLTEDEERAIAALKNFRSHVFNNKHWDMHKFRKLPEDLESFSLVVSAATEKGNYSVHPLIHRWAREIYSAEGGFRQQTMILLATSIRLSRSGVAGGARHTEQLARHVDQVVNGATLVFAGCLNEFAYVYEQAGRSKEAAEHWEEYKEACWRAPETDHPASIALIMSLAERHYEEGRAEERQSKEEAARLQEKYKEEMVDLKKEMGAEARARDDELKAQLVAEYEELVKKLSEEHEHQVTMERKRVEEYGRERERRIVEDCQKALERSEREKRWECEQARVEERKKAAEEMMRLKLEHQEAVAGLKRELEENYEKTAVLKRKMEEAVSGNEELRLRVRLAGEHQAAVEEMIRAANDKAKSQDIRLQETQNELEKSEFGRALEEKQVEEIGRKLKQKTADELESRIELWKQHKEMVNLKKALEKTTADHDALVKRMERAAKDERILQEMKIKELEDKLKQPGTNVEVVQPRLETVQQTREAEKREAEGREGVTVRRETEKLEKAKREDEGRAHYTSTGGGGGGMETLRRSRPRNDIPSPSVALTTSSFSILPLPRSPPNHHNHSSHLPAPHADPSALVETQPYNPQGRIRRFMTFLGYGSPTLRARRALVSLYTSLIFYAIQFVVIMVVLIVAAKSKSPTNPSLNEWEACSKPLGVWGALWVARTCFATVLAYWGWRRGPRANRSNRTGSEESIPLISRDIEAPRSPIARTGTSQNFSNMLADPSPPLAPESRLFTRLSVLSSLCSLGWFLTAQVFEYTSIDTCRHSSPHLFWLVFGILCMVYLRFLEVVMLGLSVFIIAPLLFLFWNLVLFILGRYPLQNPVIRPEIGKLPKALVDCLPLVIYIPPLPEDEASPKNGMGTTPPHATYPPKPPASAHLKSKRRFKFLRQKGKTADSKEKSVADESAIGQGKNTWEFNWEQSEYPFVRLEEDRAVCSICLMDFEKPPRVRTELHLVDAGEGSQPLRLLPCGHAFHKTCIDPWLTDVSGRCAVCQRAVELPSEEKGTK